MHNNMQIFYRVPARERDRGGEREGERERERERERLSHTHTTLYLSRVDEEFQSRSTHESSQRFLPHSCYIRMCKS
jgi:hypothetical protein